MTVIYLDQYRKAKVLIAAADRHIAEVLYQIPPLVTAIKDEYPSIGVTVLSGDEDIQSDVMSRGADVFMPTPFVLRNCWAALKQCL
jgi:DNA-binding transcriptional LysR family regulator